MKRYVVGIAFNESMTHVLLIRKEGGPFPDKLNGLGGHIEEGESEDAAMLREFSEESQINLHKVIRMHKIVEMRWPDVELHCYYIILRHKDLGYIYASREGLVEWHNIKEDKLLDAGNLDLAGCGNVPFFIASALINEGILY